MRDRVIRFVGAVMFASVVFAAARPATATCPHASTVMHRLAALDLDRGSRQARFSTDFPVELYDKAARNVGRAFADREGDQGFGALVTEIPVESLWKAINDESHHAQALPVRHSEVIDGTPRGERRSIFQWAAQLGVGRWWVSEVRMNGDLFRTSEGAMWEIHWEDSFDGIDPSKPPIAEPASRFEPIARSRGAWLLVPLAESCTLVEYYSSTDPGGSLGPAQRLFLARMIRRTLKGVALLAGKHLLEPHPGEPFRRPDGTPID